jgi:LPS sulfotransferase NodH
VRRNSPTSAARNEGDTCHYSWRQLEECRIREFFNDVEQKLLQSRLRASLISVHTQDPDALKQAMEMLAAGATGDLREVVDTSEASQSHYVDEWIEGTVGGRP